MVNGNNILIYATYNGTTQAVATTRSLSVQVGAEMIEIASPDSGEWRAYLAGRKNWAINVGWLVSSFSDIDKVLLTAQTVTIRIVGRGETYGLTGTALVQTARVDSNVGNLANGSFAFQGTGPLTKETAPTT